MTLTSYLCLVTKTSKARRFTRMVAIWTLQWVHAATHPAALLEGGDKPSSKTADPEADALFPALIERQKRESRFRLSCCLAALRKKSESRYHHENGNNPHLGVRCRT